MPDLRLKRGLYDTEYGNVAYVSGPNAKTAEDLDAGERIPVTLLVLSTWRPATSC